MKLADVNDALGSSLSHYRFYLNGGAELVGRTSGISPTNDLLIVLYELHQPAGPSVVRRILIRLDAIDAIEEMD